MCAKEKERRKQGLFKKKTAMGYYSIAAYFILLYNLEADTQ